MIEYDAVEEVIVPEVPKVLENQQINVYVPLGTHQWPGIVQPYGDHFEFGSGGPNDTSRYLKISKTLLDKLGDGTPFVPPDLRENESGLIGLANSNHRNLHYHLNLKVDGADITDAQYNSNIEVDPHNTQKAIRERIRAHNLDTSSHPYLIKLINENAAKINTYMQLQEGEGRVFVIATWEDLKNAIEKPFEPVFSFKGLSEEEQLVTGYARLLDLVTGDTILVIEKNTPDFYVVSAERAPDNFEEETYNGVTLSYRDNITSEVAGYLFTYGVPLTNLVDLSSVPGSGSVTVRDSYNEFPANIEAFDSFIYGSNNKFLNPRQEWPLRHTVVFGEFNEICGYNAFVAGHRNKVLPNSAVFGNYNSYAGALEGYVGPNADASGNSLVSGSGNTYGSHSMVAGGDNSVASYSVVGGYWHTVGNYALVGGHYNNVGDYALVGGDRNTVSSNGVAGGFGNTVDSYSAGFGHGNIVYECGFVAGRWNDVGSFSGAVGESNMPGLHSFVSGKDNTCRDFCLIAGESNTSSRSYNAIFGNNNNVKSPTNLVAGDNNYIEGEKKYVEEENGRNVCIGHQNTIKHGTSLSWGNAVFGLYNYVGPSDDTTKESHPRANLVGGYGNKVYSQMSIVGGNNNIDRDGFSIIGGFNNVLNGNYSIVGGADNIVTGNRSLVAGESNLAYGEYNTVVGYKNNSTGAGSVITGFNNQSSADLNAIFGEINDSDQRLVFMSGKGLVGVKEACAYFGTYNDINDHPQGTKFSLGTGWKTADVGRRTAFMIGRRAGENYDTFFVFGSEADPAGRATLTAEHFKHLYGLKTRGIIDYLSEVDASTTALVSAQVLKAYVKDYVSQELAGLDELLDKIA